jgi:hypothetical protein
MADTRNEALKREGLTLEIERLLPDFARSCRDSTEVVIIHQDSFAADYQDEEYALFGKAMKFAGIYGKEIRVIGKNRETLTHGEGRPRTVTTDYPSPPSSFSLSGCR